MYWLLQCQVSKSGKIFPPKLVSWGSNNRVKGGWQVERDENRGVNWELDSAAWRPRGNFGARGMETTAHWVEGGTDSPGKKFCWEWKHRNKQVAKGWLEVRGEIFEAAELGVVFDYEKEESVRKGVVAIGKERTGWMNNSENVLDPEESTRREGRGMGAIWFVYQVMRIWRCVSSNGFYFLANSQTRVWKS